MPTFHITSPDGATYEVTGPDGATEQDALAQVQASIQQPKSQEQKLADSRKEQQAQQMREMSGPQKFFAAAGAAPMNMKLGIRQMMGAEDQADVDAQRRLDQPLMNTGAGRAGNIVGNIATLVPAIGVPGANTVAGAGVIGALSSAFQPTSADESRLQNTVLGGVTGAGAQYGLGKLLGAAQSRLSNAEASAATAQNANQVKDATLKAAQEAGYVVPPSMAGGSVTGRLMEGLSGKYKTNQLASIRNQNVTDTLAKRAVGLAEDTPITPEALQAVRSEAFTKGYEPVMAAGTIKTDKAYTAALDTIVSDRQGAARSFPRAVKNEVDDFIQTLKEPQIDAGDAVAMIRVLREDASQAYAQGNKALGKANREAAKVIEDQIERHLNGLGKKGADILKNFREARTLIAKTHSVEDALVAEGGKVNSKVLGASLQKGKPLTDELKTIGAFANNFKDVAAIPKSGWANPLTILDMAGGTFGGLPGQALAGARVGARYGLLSGPGQKMFAKPDYSVGAGKRLTPEMLAWLEKYGGGGLLGSAVYASQ